MKILKYVLSGLLGLILLFLLVTALLPSEYRVERSVLMNAPDSVIYATLIDFNLREDWDPWMEMEPSAKHTISGAEKGVGSKWSWEGEELGSGYLIIEEVVENRSIRSKLVFTEPRADEGDVYWDISTTSDGTKVSWALGGKLNYPEGRMMGPFLEGMLAPQLEKGLLNLKEMVEK